MPSHSVFSTFRRAGEKGQFQTTLGPADLCSRSLRCAGRSLWWMRTGTVGFPSSDETGALTAGGSGGSSSAMQESMLGAADAASSAPDDVEAGSSSGSSASGGLALSDVTAPEPLYRRTSPRCAPCSLGRCAASIGGVLVPGLVCLTLVPFVFHHPYLPEPWAIADVAVFLVLLSLLLASWLHTVFVDPGSTPIEWHQHISRSSAFVRDRYRLCPKTDMYRPPRSHFDSITRRVVLNMDHFCPWVCNTVGYFNRKVCATLPHVSSSFRLPARSPACTAWKKITALPSSPPALAR
jgi:hypothetical protein